MGRNKVNKTLPQKRNYDAALMLEWIRDNVKMTLRQRQSDKQYNLSQRVEDTLFYLLTHIPKIDFM